MAPRRSVRFAGQPAGRAIGPVHLIHLDVMGEEAVGQARSEGAGALHPRTAQPYPVWRAQTSAASGRRRRGFGAHDLSQRRREPRRAYPHSGRPHPGWADPCSRRCCALTEPALQTHARVQSQSKRTPKTSQGHGPHEAPTASCPKAADLTTKPRRSSPVRLRRLTAPRKAPRPDHAVSLVYHTAITNWADAPRPAGPDLLFHARAGLA